MNYDLLKHSWYQYPCYRKNTPHAFFKHKAKKILFIFEKVFRLHAFGLHIRRVLAS